MNIKPENTHKKQFWTKNTKPLPGKLTQQGENNAFHQNSWNFGCSFKRFQSTIDDVWINDEDDDILSEKKVIIVPKLQNKDENILKEAKQKPKYPGKPLPQTCNHMSSNYDIFKQRKFEKVLENPTLNLEYLKQLSWSGIPNKIRPKIWKILTGYMPLNPERRIEVMDSKRVCYKNLVNQCYLVEKDDTNKKIYKQIKIDIPRMNPHLKMFQQKIVQDIFERILYIWAVRNPATGYVQGINDLATPFFIVFLSENKNDLLSLTQEERNNIEADTFWCLTKFLNHIQENYIFSQLGIQKIIVRLQELIQRIDFNLHNHLVSNGIDYLQFSYRWINNLLTRELPLNCIIRLWDTYLSESESFGNFHLYVCAAFLVHWRELLLKENDFQGLILLLQNLPTKNWTVFDVRVLVAEAYRLRFMFEDSPKHLQCYKN